MITIDKEKCVRCGRCAMVCPSFVLLQKEKQGEIQVTGEGACIRCGHCMDVCPSQAMQHEAFPTEMVRKVDTDILPSPDSLMELIRSRRSNRTMTEKPLSEHAKNMILEAARYAPTAENSRNVREYIITDQEIIKRVDNKVMDFFMTLVKPLMWKPLKTLLSPFCRKLYLQAAELQHMDAERREGRRPATVNAAAILVVTAPVGSRFGYQDCNLAYQNASLMAQTLGLSQVYLGFVQTAFGMWGTKRTAKLLGIPAGEKAFAIMALGYPAFKYINYTVKND